MRAWTSPGNRRKSTSCRAMTPGNCLVMPVMVSMVQSDSLVLAVREGGLGLLGRELALHGQDAGLDRLARDDLLGEVHELRAKQRAALDDVVDLAGGQGGHAVLDRVDRDDLDVGSGLLAGRL